MGFIVLVFWCMGKQEIARMTSYLYTEMLQRDFEKIFSKPTLGKPGKDYSP